MHFNLLRALVACAPFVLLFANRGMVILFGALVVASLPLLRRPLSLPWPPLVTLAAMAYLVLGAVSIAWEVEAGNALFKLPELVGLLLGGAVLSAAAAAMPREWGEGLVVAAILGLAASVAVALADAASHMALTIALKGLAGNKTIGLFSPQPTMFKPAASVAAVMAAPLLGWTLIRRRWALGALAAVALVALTVISRSHAALLGLVCGAGLGLVWWWRPRWGAAVLAVLVLGLFAVFPFADHLPHSKRLAGMGIPNSTTHRTVIWGFVAEKIAERPILGWGLNSSRAIPGGDDSRPVWLAQVPPNVGLATQDIQVLPLHPHNFILQVWLETGAVGAVLFVAFLLGLIRAAARLPARAGAVVGTTVLAGVLVGGVTFGLWQAWWLASLWLVALLLEPIRRDQAEGVR